MDVNDLFLSCRRGDLERVRYLVEQKEVELNVRDKWDSTPLYYACLCGGETLVKYMLQNGAKCEANTFDGERCLYGALTDKIRRLLRSYKAITSNTIRRGNYDEFLRRTLEQGLYSDVTFVVHEQHFKAHRSILSARSDYFANMFNTKWKDRDTVSLKHKLLEPWAFHAIFQYLYTAKLKVDLDDIDGIMKMAKQCQLYQLIGELEDKMKKTLSFVSTKPGVNVTVICLEPKNSDNSSLHWQIGQLADWALPEELADPPEFELPFPPEDPEVPEQAYPDLVIQVEGRRFHCHKVFFCGRSEYFKALLKDHFGEASKDETGQLPVIRLHDVNTDIFIQILYYIYQDRCKELTASNVHDVLCAADIYLMQGLKRQCGNVIGQYLEVDNVVSILRTSRLFNMPRLEDQCAQFIAGNVEQVLALQEFAEFVKEDAESVQSRQETDTILIIDDVRYHISSHVQTLWGTFDAEQKLDLIDAFLEKLNLEG